ncbi:MAG: glycosyltransferase family 2 protein [Clostridia bacterium]|nr:glycosyltransferase family 2 protein [Clostridia bacterium]
MNITNIGQNIKPLVVIRCCTYNHEHYIREALEGFIKQETTFRFVAIIHDDASTDGTAEIIKQYAAKYPSIIYPILESENQYSKNDGSIRRIMNDACLSTGAKYIAICEGDDYWTDPTKLQRQVEIMEKYPDVMLCFHRIYRENEKHPERSGLGKNVNDRFYSGVEWFKERPSQTASFMYRSSIICTDLYKRIFENRKFIVGDIPLVMTCAEVGDLYGLSRAMSVYRINSGGWTSQSRSRDERWKTISLQLEYKVFGQEVAKVAQYFAQKDAMSYFLTDLVKKKKFSLQFLKFSLSISVLGTFKAVYKLCTHQNN